MEGKLIFKKIIDVMADIEAISKDQKNTQQGFKFRGIDDIYNEMHPLLAKHGVFNTTEILERAYKERATKSGGMMIERILTIRFRFFAEDGSFVDSIIDGESMDTGDKATNKCLSIAHKYALLQLFCIPTIDHEKDGPKDPDFVSPDLDPDGDKGNSNYKKPVTNPANSPIKPKEEIKPPFQMGAIENQKIKELTDMAKMTKEQLPAIIKAQFGCGYNQMTEANYKALVEFLQHEAQKELNEGF